MKVAMAIIGTVLLLMAALATPIAIGLGLYDWGVNDMELKHAALDAFVTWAVMLATGLGIGLPLSAIGAR